MKNARRIKRIVTETGTPVYITMAGLLFLLLSIVFIAVDFVPIGISLIGASGSAAVGMWLIFQADIVHKRQLKRQRRLALHEEDQ